MTFSEQQANIECDPKLQMRVPKEELESLKIENFLLDMQLAQLKTEAFNVMLHRAISEAMIKARIDQYEHIPNPDPWRDNDL